MKSGRVQKKRGQNLSSLCLIVLAVVMTAGLFLQGCSDATRIGNDDDNMFMVYEGPVFPLTLAEKNENITTTRNIAFDFVPATPEWHAGEGNEVFSTKMIHALRNVYSKWWPEQPNNVGTRYDALVVEHYTFHNHSDQDQKIRALYPVASDFQNIDSEKALFWIDDEYIPTKIYPGNYTRTQEKEDHSGNMVNVYYPDNWKGYETMMDDGKTLEQAVEQAEFPKYKPVKVYKLTHLSKQIFTEENSSVTIRFDMNADKTDIIPLGFNRIIPDWEKGTMTFKITNPGKANMDDTYILVIGDDISNLRVTDNVKVVSEKNRSQKNKDQALLISYHSDLYTQMREMLERRDTIYAAGPMPLFEERCRLLWKESVNILEESVENRGNAWEELLILFHEKPRLFWQETELTVPAGKSLTLTIVNRKTPNYDYGDFKEEEYEYEMLTTLGSNLQFTEQTASIVDRDLIDIIHQNFGFDLKKGVRNVTLDMKEPYYYLSVKFKGNKK